MSTLTQSAKEKLKPRATRGIDGWITLHHTTVWCNKGTAPNEPVHIKATSIIEVRPHQRNLWGKTYQGEFIHEQCAIFTTGSGRDPSYFVHGRPSEILALIAKAQGGAV